MNILKYILTNFLIFYFTISQVLCSLQFKISENVPPNTLIANLKENLFQFDQFSLMQKSNYVKIDSKSGKLYTIANIDREQICPTLTKSFNQGSDSNNCILDIEILSKLNRDINIISLQLYIMDENDNRPMFILQDKSVNNYSSFIFNSNTYNTQKNANNTHMDLSELTKENSLISLPPAIDIDSKRYQVEGYRLLLNESLVVLVESFEISLKESHEKSFQNESNINCTASFGKWLTNFKNSLIESTFRLETLNSDENVRMNHEANKLIPQLRILQKVDGEQIDYFNFTIEAYDGGSPSLTSKHYIQISIQDENDNAPIFTRQLYRFYVNERRDKPTFRVTAIDKDITKLNKLIIYQFAHYSKQPMGQNLLKLFQIDPYTGLISLVDGVKSLDYELSSDYVLIAEAHNKIEKDVQKIFGECTIIITVRDENDNSPIINIKPLTKVFNQYYINNSNSNSKTLKTELNVSYDLTFEPTLEEWGDLQNFNQQEYVVLGLDENTKSTVLAIISTSDLDTVEINGKISCSIIKINSIYKDKTKVQNKFVVIEKMALSKYKIMTTLDIIDREKIDRLSLYLECHDNGQNEIQYTRKIIFIQIFDRNDNLPQFLLENVAFFIQENSPVGTHINKAQLAIDNDVSLENSRLIYLMSKNVSQILQIDKFSGIIQNKIIFDYELTKRVYFSIRVCQNSMISGYTQLKIARELSVSRRTVQEIIEKHQKSLHLINRPKKGRPIKMSVREDCLLQIKAKSNPFLTANELQNSILSGSKVSLGTVKRSLRRSGLFGRIALKKHYLKTLNKRKRLKWCQNRLNWSDHDWDFCVYSEETKINLNSRARKLSHVNATVKLSPSIMVWGAIMQNGKKFLVRCFNRVNSHEYYIKNENMYFENEELGTCIENAYTLNVLDIDDNKPMFLKRSFRFEIEENTASGSIVGQLEAFDADTLKKNTLFYYGFEKKERNIKRYFKIDPNRGFVIAKIPLDREKTEMHHFKVVVCKLKERHEKIQRDNNCCCDTVGVTVYVIDINDNAPIFHYPPNVNGEIFDKNILNSKYRLKKSVNCTIIKFPSKSVAGAKISRILATDRDRDENSKLTFEIGYVYLRIAQNQTFTNDTQISNKQQEFIRLNQNATNQYITVSLYSGTIFLKKLVDQKDENQFYIISIIASDNCKYLKLRKSSVTWIGISFDKYMPPITQNWAYIEKSNNIMNKLIPGVKEMTFDYVSFMERPDLITIVVVTVVTLSVIVVFLIIMCVYKTCPFLFDKNKNVNVLKNNHVHNSKNDVFMSTKEPFSSLIKFKQMQIPCSNYENVNYNFPKIDDYSFLNTSKLKYTDQKNGKRSTGSKNFHNKNLDENSQVYTDDSGQGGSDLQEDAVKKNKVQLERCQNLLTKDKVINSQALFSNQPSSLGNSSLSPKKSSLLQKFYDEL
ncbi:hypothetical protein A3Q56_05780, partial [Intoshia linei]